MMGDNMSQAARERIKELERERDFLRQRERDICAAIGGVSDGGRFRNDVIEHLRMVLSERDAEKKRADEAEARLPEGMKHCTILFKECEKGHGWLTATNWVQHGCPWCEIEAAETRERRLRVEVEKAIELIRDEADRTDVENAEYVLRAALSHKKGGKK